MNIYDFFNSKDISEHCQKIGYKLTSVETAYMIWLSDHHTLAEKHSAWHEVIDTMPDEDFPTNWDFDGNTLHNFLKIYMRLQNEFISDFLQSNGNYVYTSETLDINDDSFASDDIMYSSYETCVSALKKYTIEDDPYNELDKVKIVRQRLYSNPISFENATESECIIFDKLLNPLSIEPRQYDDTDDRKYLNAAMGFYEMWVAIPTPFKQGDIVTVKYSYDYIKKKHKPFVLELLPYQRRNHSNTDAKEYEKYHLEFGVDWTDMDACLWLQDNDGEIYWDHQHCYLDLEYYRDELVGKENLLRAFSSHIQGKITTEDLLRCHSIILREEYAKELRNYFGYNANEELLYNSGLK